LHPSSVMFCLVRSRRCADVSSASAPFRDVHLPPVPHDRPCGRDGWRTAAWTVGDWTILSGVPGTGHPGPRRSGYLIRTALPLVMEPDALYRGDVVAGSAPGA